MKPRWFAIPSLSGNYFELANELEKDERGDAETSHSTIPLNRMWVDDRLWLPLLLSKRRFVGRVDFVDDTNPPEATDTGEPWHPMVKWWFATLD